MRRGLLEAGESVLLIDRKRRRYLVELRAGEAFHSHSGVLDHDALIGAPEGSSHRSTRGANFLAVRPTYADFVLKMPRGAQVIYPKDVGPILINSDIHPGVRVLESGLGSGALSTALLRAGAEIVGYELRADFEARARANVARFLGEDAMSRYVTQVRDVYEGVDEIDLDRVILDLPEPWQVVGHAAGALRLGGIFCAYTPSITQAIQLTERLDDSPFGMVDTIEVLHRGWHIEGAAVRPNHRMVAHTAFLTTARLLHG